MPRECGAKSLEDEFDAVLWEAIEPAVAPLRSQLDLLDEDAATFDEGKANGHDTFAFVKNVVCQGAVEVNELMEGASTGLVARGMVEANFEAIDAEIER